MISLSSTVLSELIKSQLHSPDTAKFKPDPAIQLWYTNYLRPRRPDFVSSSGNVSSGLSDDVSTCMSTGASDSLSSSDDDNHDNSELLDD